MEQFFEEKKFLLILQSEDIDNLSERWQEICKDLYDELSKALPEGYVKPSTREISKGEKPFDIFLFSTIVFSEIAAKFCASIIFEVLDNWSENRNAYIKVQCLDGSIIKIPREYLSKLSDYSNENPNFSICEALTRVINSTK